jgi:hypothetical protein
LPARHPGCDAHRVLSFVNAATRRGRDHAVSKRALVTVAVLFAGLLLPAAASGYATLFDSFQELAGHRQNPVILIPTQLPASLQPFDTADGEALANGTSHAYQLTMWRGRGPRIVLDRDALPSLAALHSSSPGDRVSSIRVRGRRGELRIHRFSVGFEIVWVEQHHLYELSSSSKRAFTARQLVQVANGLEPIVGFFAGSQAGVGADAVAVVTKHTVDLLACDGVGVGVLLPLRHGVFSATNLPSASRDSRSSPNQVSGTFNGTTVSMTMHSSPGSGLAAACDTGTTPLILTRIPPTSPPPAGTNGSLITGGSRRPAQAGP